MNNRSARIQTSVLGSPNTLAHTHSDAQEFPHNAKLSMRYTSLLALLLLLVLKFAPATVTQHTGFAQLNKLLFLLLNPKLLLTTA